MNPKVSIVIPIYNVSRYLDQALESAKRQTLKDIEIICINDGSTDDSLDIIKKWAEGDDRFVVIDKENEGYGVGMNIGIGKATGEYIAILEPDDFVPLNMYEDLYEIAKANDLDMVKADFYKFTESNATRNMALRYIPLDRTGQFYNKVLDPSRNPEITKMVSYTWTGIYRREFLEKYNIRHNTTPGASFQDIGFFWMTTVHAERAMFIDKPYYMYRSDNPNQSVKNRDKVYFRDHEFDYVKELLVSDSDPEMWERFGKYYYARRFRRSLTNIKRIDDAYAEEYREFMTDYFKGVVQAGEFDDSILSSDEKKAFDMMLESPEAFLKRYHTRKAEIERENNTDIWEVLKSVKKQNKELKKEDRKLKEKLEKIENSKTFKTAKAIRRLTHPGSRG